MGTPVLILACIVWGMVHSLLASLPVKDFIRRWLGPDGEHSYRLSYNIFSVLSLIPILILLYTSPDRMLYAIPEPWVYVTTLLQGLAGIALIAGVVQTDILEFMGLRQFSWDAPPAQKKLVTNGLYAYMRHPLYTFGLLFIWLSAEMTLNRLAVFATLTVYILVGIHFEERKLLKEFGADYQAYRARTPMLLPRLSRKS